MEKATFLVNFNLFKINFLVPQKITFKITIESLGDHKKNENTVYRMWFVKTL